MIVHSHCSLQLSQKISLAHQAGLDHTLCMLLYSHSIPHIDAQPLHSTCHTHSLHADIPHTQSKHMYVCNTHTFVHTSVHSHKLLLHTCTPWILHRRWQSHMHTHVYILVVIHIHTYMYTYTYTHTSHIGTLCIHTACTSLTHLTHMHTCVQSSAKRTIYGGCQINSTQVYYNAKCRTAISAYSCVSVEPSLSQFVIRIVLVTLLNAGTKYLTKQLKEEFHLAHSLRAHSPQRQGRYGGREGMASGAWSSQSHRICGQRWEPMFSLILLFM